MHICSPLNGISVWLKQMKPAYWITHYRIQIRVASIQLNIKSPSLRSILLAAPSSSGPHYCANNVWRCSTQLGSESCTHSKQVEHRTGSSSWGGVDSQGAFSPQLQWWCVFKFSHVFTLRRSNRGGGESRRSWRGAEGGGWQGQEFPHDWPEARPF